MSLSVFSINAIEQAKTYNTIDTDTHAHGYAYAYTRTYGHTDIRMHTHSTRQHCVDCSREASIIELRFFVFIRAVRSGVLLGNNTQFSHRHCTMHLCAMTLECCEKQNRLVEMLQRIMRRSLVLTHA